MISYDPGKWNGLSRLDSIISFNEKTGKPMDLVAAVDEIARTAFESDKIINLHMQNVPESVRQALMLLTMSVGTLAAIIRARVVTGPLPQTEEPK